MRSVNQAFTSRALLAGASDKSHLHGINRPTCSTVKNTPFPVKYRWWGRNDRLVYYWNDKDINSFSWRKHFPSRNHSYQSTGDLLHFDQFYFSFLPLSIRLMRLLSYFNCFSWITFPRPDSVTAHTHTHSPVWLWVVWRWTCTAATRLLFSIGVFGFDVPKHYHK